MHKMSMNVFINAISISEGGGLVVLKNLLEQMTAMEAQTNWYIAVHPEVLPQLPKSNNIICLPFAWPNKSAIHLMFWYNVVLPKLIKQTKADVIFSQTNFLSHRKLSCPSLLLVQQAGYFSDKFKTLYLKSYQKKSVQVIWEQKIKWVKHSIKRASLVTVQTNALAEKIVQMTGIQENKISVIPHGLGLLNLVQLTKSKTYPKNNIWRIGYITKFGVQKDFDTLFKAIAILKKLGANFKLILTLDPNYPKSSFILEQIKYYGIEDVVENCGEIEDSYQIKSLYESLHLFVFPSLCESFGFPLVEAMASGLPIIAADTDSNSEVTGKAGHLYTAENHQDLADQMQCLIKSKELYEISSMNSVTRSKDFSWQKAAKDILSILHQLTTRVTYETTQ